MARLTLQEVEERALRGCGMAVILLLASFGLISLLGVLWQM